jgi:hypothetical protein
VSVGDAIDVLYPFALVAGAVLALFLHGRSFYTDPADDEIITKRFFLYLLAVMAWPLTISGGLLAGAVVCIWRAGAYTGRLSSERAAARKRLAKERARLLAEVDKELAR